MCGPWKRQATRGSKYSIQCQRHTAFHYETISTPKLPTFISRMLMLTPRQHQQPGVINSHYNENMPKYVNGANPRKASTQRWYALNVVPKALAIFVNIEVYCTVTTFKRFVIKITSYKIHAIFKDIKYTASILGSFKNPSKYSALIASNDRIRNAEVHNSRPSCGRCD